MSAETIGKRCENCTLGEQSSNRVLNLVPLKLVATPIIERNCLSRFEKIKDSLLSEIEDVIGRDTPIERVERIVATSAECVKPDSYSPRE